MASHEFGPLDPVSILGTFADRLAKDPDRETLRMTVDGLSEYLRTLPGNQPHPDPEVIMADLCSFVDEKGVEISAGDCELHCLRRISVATDRTGVVFEKEETYRPESLDA